MSEALRRAAPVLAAQHALITSRQALDLGINRQQCLDLVRRGIWERIDRGIYGPAGVPLAWRRQVMAAVLLSPEGSLVSHRCAACLLGVGGLETPAPEVTIPRGRNLRRSWITTHESTDLHLADRRLIDGIPITGPRRLAMDLGGVVSEARYRHTMRELRFGHGVSAEALLRTYLRHKRSGRNGGGSLRDWLDRYYAIQGVPESGLEQVVLDALLDAGLPAPLAQLWVDAAGRCYRLDFAYPAHRVAIEVDGSQHDDPEHRAADAVRDGALQALGWTVIRIRAGRLATDLRAAIEFVRARLRDSPVVRSADS